MQLCNALMSVIFSSTILFQPPWDDVSQGSDYFNVPSFFQDIYLSDLFLPSRHFIDDYNLHFQPPNDNSFIFNLKQ